MRFEFNDLAELEHFIKWSGHLHLREVAAFQAASESALRLATPETVTEASDEAAPTAIGEDRADFNVEQPAAEKSIEEPAKRKRRTKAEIEADKAAEAQRLAANAQANATADANLAEHGAEAAAVYAKPETTPAGTTTAVASENTGNPFAQQSLPPADTRTEPENPPKSALAAPPAKTGNLQHDCNEFVAARLQERPELDQKSHLDLARLFIGKHGMSKYQQSQELTGLSANVMVYTPADCARHAAALEFLSLE